MTRNPSHGDDLELTTSDKGRAKVDADGACCYSTGSEFTRAWMKKMYTVKAMAKCRELFTGKMLNKIPSTGTK